MQTHIGINPRVTRKMLEQVWIMQHVETVKPCKNLRKLDVTISVTEKNGATLLSALNGSTSRQESLSKGAREIPLKVAKDMIARVSKRFIQRAVLFSVTTQNKCNFSVAQKSSTEAPVFRARLDKHPIASRPIANTRFYFSGAGVLLT